MEVEYFWGASQKYGLGSCKGQVKTIHKKKNDLFTFVPKNALEAFSLL
jgi:hypothetical protein